jgi:aerobic-type carbon monoxide dehydrogenase small subunit (CoxS/CutS family)
MRDDAIRFRLNGEAVEIPAQTEGHLADLLRHHFRLTGTHLGCEHGVCGACNVRLNDRVARSCLTLAAQLDGMSVETIEGVTASGAAGVLQSAFVAHNALQCGYCTPGMIMTAMELLVENPAPSRTEIREALSGNYCRCTGYHAIVDAIAAAAATLGDTHA